MISNSPNIVVQPSRIHAYSASFGSDLAYDLILGSTIEGDTILDPFSGAGTALLQARLLGRGAIGIDVDPVANLITQVLITQYSVDEIDYLAQSIERQLYAIEDEWSAVDDGNSLGTLGSKISLNGFYGVIPEKLEIEFWFTPIQRALLAILVALAKSYNEEKLRRVVEVAISSSIIRKWPNTLSQARDIDHSRPHRVIREDVTLTSQLAIFRRAFARVVDILKELNEHTGTPENPIQVIHGDSESILRSLKPSIVDYIITSPPYFNAIDYPRSHKFSQWWLWPNHEKLSRNRYLGLKPGGNNSFKQDGLPSWLQIYEGTITKLDEMDRPKYLAFGRYVLDMIAVIDELYRILKPGKKLTFILANNVVKGVVLPVADIMADCLEYSGFTSIRRDMRQIRSDRRRYPFGIKGFKGLMESEFIITAHKPSSGT